MFQFPWGSEGTAVQPGYRLRVCPCMTLSIMSLACTMMWIAMSRKHVSVQRLVSPAGTVWRWLRGLCG